MEKELKHSQTHYMFSLIYINLRIKLTCFNWNLYLYWLNSLFWAPNKHIDQSPTSTFALKEALALNLKWTVFQLFWVEKNLAA